MSTNPPVLPPASDAPAPPRKEAPDAETPLALAVQRETEAVAMIRCHLEYVCKPGAPLLAAWAKIETLLAGRTT